MNPKGKLTSRLMISVMKERLSLPTLISALFMPLTLIAGIYGMNFRDMPELTWPYGYPLMIGVMVTLAAVLLWIFYLKGWFK